KTPVSPHMVALFFLSSLAPLTAQNLASASRSSENSTNAGILDESRNLQFADDSALPGNYEVPAVDKAQGQMSDGKPVYAAQDTLTLNTEASSPRNVESVVDLNVLRHPSPYRRIAVSSRGGAPSEIAADSLQSGLALISAVYRESGKSEKGADCLKVTLSAEQRIKLDPAKVLEVVESEVGANPSCACEIVKMAITASEADVELVVSIVETAITVSPDSMRIVSQCAIATMPESITAVQALLAKLDPNSGDESPSSKSSKSAKSAKVASIVSTPLPDPLDRPYLPPIPPPPHFPPPVTDVDPCTY
ncbi:MAG: hypothetical protein ABI600_18515, partial [Luteolibacter sp.]